MREGEGSLEVGGVINCQVPPTSPDGETEGEPLDVRGTSRRQSGKEVSMQATRLQERSLALPPTQHWASQALPERHAVPHLSDVSPALSDRLLLAAKLPNTAGVLISGPGT